MSDEQATPETTDLTPTSAVPSLLLFRASDVMLQSLVPHHLPKQSHHRIRLSRSQTKDRETNTDTRRHGTDHTADL